MREPFCGDCPDHEACGQGAPCSLVKRVEAEASAKKRNALHVCDLESPSDGYGAAVNNCFEREDGTLWVGNSEYGSQVNYCPVCGTRASTQIERRQTARN